MVRRISALVLVGLVSAVLIDLGAQQPPETITVVHGRPLATMIQNLETRFGWAITYEDPPYVHSSETVDVTSSVRRDGKSSPKVLAPLGGGFAFTLPPKTAQQYQPAAVLNALIDQYNRSGNPGNFRLLKTDDVYHVVPTLARDEAAAIRTYRSILDRTITIPDGERDGLEMLDLIVKTTGAAGEPGLRMGTVPIQPALMKVKVTGGASREDARSVLLRTLNATKLRLAWRILCKPGKGEPCYFNVHVVR